MAAGNPKFGGSNGVPELDIGQEGGTRATEGDAKTTINVIPGPEESVEVQHALPQQNVVFTDRLGYRGATVTWECTIRAKTNVIFNAIVSELNQLRHGSGRDATTGLLTAPDPTLLRETRLTDYDAIVLNEKAVLSDWRPRGRRMASSEWAVILRATLVFRLLG